MPLSLWWQESHSLLWPTHSPTLRGRSEDCPRPTLETQSLHPRPETRDPGGDRPASVGVGAVGWSTPETRRAHPTSGGAFSYERGTPVESGSPELASGGLRWGETNTRFLGEAEQSASMAPMSAEAGLSPESPSRRWRLAVLRSPIAGSRSPLLSRSSTSPLAGLTPYVPRPLPPN